MKLPEFLDELFANKLDASTALAITVQMMPYKDYDVEIIPNDESIGNAWVDISYPDTADIARIDYQEGRILIVVN